MTDAIETKQALIRNLAGFANASLVEAATLRGVRSPGTRKHLVG